MGCFPFAEWVETKRTFIGPVGTMGCLGIELVTSRTDRCANGKLRMKITFLTSSFTYEHRQVREERNLVPGVCLVVSGVDVDSITNFSYYNYCSDIVLLMFTVAL